MIEPIVRIWRKIVSHTFWYLNTCSWLFYRAFWLRPLLFFWIGSSYKGAGLAIVNYFILFFSFSEGFSKIKRPLLVKIDRNKFYYKNFWILRSKYQLGMRDLPFQNNNSATSKSNLRQNSNMSPNIFKIFRL